MDISVWDSYYSEHIDSEWSLNRPQAAILGRIGIENKKILEVGFGSGTTSAFLAESGAIAVGVDLSRGAVQRAKEKGLGFLMARADAHRLPFAQGSFDIVFSQGFLEHFKDPVPLLLEQRRVLKKSGALLLDVPQKYQPYTKMKHKKIREGTWPFGWETEYSYPELKRLLRETGFRVRGHYANGYYPEFFRLLRIAHTIGKTRFGRPIMPRRLGEIYDRLWQKFEMSIVACFVLVSVGIWGEKA